MARVYALIRRGSQRSDSDERSESMLHNNDFEHAASTFLCELETYAHQARDPARAPRGMLIGTGIALGLWGSAIVAILALT
jgi:hypothetical protein